jgi:acid phosphatase type 7
MLHLLACALLSTLLPHDGPDPIGSWRLEPSQVSGTTLKPLLGQPGQLQGDVHWVADARGQSLDYDGRTTRILLADDFSTAKQALPKQHITVNAWVSVNEPVLWGGLLGVLQDNADAETGWILGYNETNFTFGLSTVGANDGNGHMTYMPGKTKYEQGRLYHVVATYDGSEMRLYVNGKLDGSSKVQSGPILYPDHAPLVLGGYLDSNESGFHKGRIRSMKLYDQCAGADWIADAFQHQKGLAAEAPKVWIDPEMRWVIHPYLQWATTDGMTVRWETSRPASSVVRYGTKVIWTGPEDARVGTFPDTATVAEPTIRHEVRIESLTIDTPYYYQVETTDDLGRVLISPILSFQTACGEDTPFAFAVISDTQGNPAVSAHFAEHAWSLRPRFLVHPGDLVDTGSVRNQWIDDFFGSMRPLLERVPMYPVLGNHEQDARHYYDAMSLPEPEYCYAFSYGNARFFMLDTNREVGPDSFQYRWLQKELAKCKATWKIVVHHHPPFSSDENDYGDRWSGPGSEGDARVRELVTLFDKYDVDVVWNGHIHSYERTWPLKGGQAAEPGEGTTYMITGGGGGSLETPGPIRPYFQNLVQRGHHACMVAINGKTLEMRAYDLEGRLFDHLTIRKLDSK